MRGAGFALLLLLAGLACGSAGASSSGERDEPRPHATLGIVALDPLTVRGSRFVPGERVKVLLGAPPRMKGTRADARGRFTVRFRARAAGPCAGVVVQAFGSRGSRAQADATAPDCSLLSTPGERP